MAARFLPLITLLALAACGDGQSDPNANTISEDPYGATGAPGADMTDNGVTDGASGNIAANQS
jgi:hypothetical protein